jgi:hypothetical protein
LYFWQEIPLSKARHKIEKEIAHLFRKVADYSRQEYETYRKLHPNTTKQPNDPLFQVKEPAKQPARPTPQKPQARPPAPAQQAQAPQAPAQAPAQQAQAPQAPAQAQAPVQQTQAPARRKILDADSLEKLKGTGKKVREVFNHKKQDITTHIKNEVKELQTASGAIKKFVNGQPMNDTEVESVKKAASKMTEYLISMTLGGHVSAMDLAQHFAVEGVAEVAVAEQHHSAPHQDPKKTLTENNISQINFKGLGSKVKQIFSDKKKALTNHLKTKVSEFKSAGKAISKFVQGQPLTKEEHHALNQAAKEVAAATMFAAFGGHFGLLEIGKYLAIGTVAQAAVARLPKHGAYMKKGARDEQDIFIEMVMENVMKQLEKMEGYTPQQLKELAKKIRQNMERDPKVRKELEQQFGKK